MSKSQAKFDEYNSILRKHLQAKKENYLYGDLGAPQEDFTPAIKKLFKELYDIHKGDNFYWEFCHIDVYKNTFKKRLSEYIRKYDGAADLSDFVENELSELSKVHKSAEDCYMMDTSTDTTTMKFGRLFLNEIDLNNFYSTEDPVFMTALFLSYEKKIKLLKALLSKNITEANLDAVNDLLVVKQKLKSRRNDDPQYKDKLIAAGVLVEKNPGKFEYIEGFYESILKKAEAYVHVEAEMLADSIKQNAFINFDTLPVKLKEKKILEEIDKNYESVNHYLLIDPISDLPGNLDFLLGYKNVFYIYQGDYEFHGIEDFQNQIGIIAQKRYYDGLLADLERIQQTQKQQPQSKSTSDKGRPKTETKHASKLIKTIDNKNGLLEALKTFFPHNDKKKSVHIVIALQVLNWLDLSNKDAVRISFNEYFGDIFGNKSLFYKHISAPDTDLLETIKKDLIELKQANEII